MDAPTPSRTIESVQQHVERLRQRAASGAAPLDEIVPQTFQELKNMLEQLRVAEEELREQNERLAAARQEAEADRQRYQDLFDFAPDGYLVTTADGTITESNRAAEVLLRAPRDSQAGKPLSLFVAENACRAFRDLVNQLQRVPGPRDGETAIQPRGAPPFPAMLRVSPVRGADGRLVALRWLVRDIRQRKEAEEAIRRERDFAEGLIQTAQAVVLVLDRDGRIVRFNAFLEELAGYALADVKGQDWFTRFLPEAARDTARGKFLGLAAGSANGVSVCPLRTRDGRLREVRWASKALLDAGGAVTGVLAIGHDITDLKEAQERAVQAERLAAIGEMVSGLSHEGRNALQRSQACLEMLALEVQDRPAALDLVTRIKRAQEHLHDLYEAVRTYAAPLNPRPRFCNLGDVVQAAWAGLDWLRKDRAATLNVDAGATDLYAEVDPDLMALVFRSIFANALAAGPNPVAIDVHWSETADGGRPMLQAAVRDHGPGLTPEQARRILEPFYTTKAHGVGLGLAIAKRIVDAHHGHISVGPAKGPGAEILVRLPRRAP
jgi:PAS domain S-box-containing protein